MKKFSEQCIRCKEWFSRKDLVETISPDEATEFYCFACMNFLDQFFKKERRQKELERLKKSVKRHE